MNERIVKFKDGTYGIRRGYFLYSYRDLKDPIFWWGINSYSFKDCRGSIDRVEQLFSYTQDVGEPI